MPAARILLVDADTDATSQILNILAGVGYTVTTIADAADALTHVGEHQLVIVDVIKGKKSADEFIAEIRGTPALARIPVLCVSQTDEVEERIRFLEAGADDVVAKPVDSRELEARIEALLLRFQRSRDASHGDAGRRRGHDRATAHRHGVQPEGRGRDDDDRDQHRARCRQHSARPGRPGRPRPAVRGRRRRSSTSSRSRRWRTSRETRRR